MRWRTSITGAGSLACAAYAARAYGTSFEPQAMGVSLEFWLGAILSIGLAVASGYTRALSKRISMIEYDNRQLQSQISAVREMVKGEYPAKSEVSDQLGEIKGIVQSLHRRMDYFAAGQRGSQFPPEDR